MFYNTKNPVKLEKEANVIYKIKYLPVSISLQENRFQTNYEIQWTQNIKLEAFFSDVFWHIDVIYQIGIFFSEAIIRKCSLKKIVLKILQNSRVKYLCWSFSLKDCNFMKTRLWRKCFTTNFTKSLRTSIL